MNRTLFSKLLIAIALVSFTIMLAMLFHKPSNLSWRDYLSDQRAAFKHAYRMQYDVKIKMRDGIVLASDLYLPQTAASKVGTVYIRLPYGKSIYAEARAAARYFAGQGYAVLVQDIRGRHGSQGQFVPYTHAVDDGYDSIEWIIAHTWSNQKVGTFGCSALGEIQMITATAPHPALKAMIARAAGGAIGSAKNRYAYFGLFDGGIYNLASGAGWHSLFDNPTGATRKPLTWLPTVQMLGAHTEKDFRNFETLLTLAPSDPQWRKLGYLSDDSQIKVPTLAFNTWYDQTIADSFVIKQLASAAHPLIIGPGNHCTGDYAGEDDRVGDLIIKKPTNAALTFPYWATYDAWFKQYLSSDSSTRPAALPQYQFFVLGENRWLQSDQWPPTGSVERIFSLSSRSGANSRAGDGSLTMLNSNDANQPEASARQFDEFNADPMNPVPTRGGPICCVDDPKIRAGAVDQTDVETRQDVLVYSTAPLPKPLRLVGPIQLQVKVSSSAPDTDFIARLVDVTPDGKTFNIQEGALRMRYRRGFDNPQPLTPNQPETVTIDLRPTAYLLPQGHRLRLQIASSSFPRLERNLQTGGNNALQTQAQVARNVVWYGSSTRLTLWQL
jgi:uncharacterized protein